MKKKKFLGTAFAAALSVTFASCDNPQVVQNSASVRGAVEDNGEEYAGFEVQKPASFEGDFNPEEKAVGPQVGQLAPEIKGTDLDGIEFKLSDYRGKVVMLDFWGDW